MKPVTHIMVMYLIGVAMAVVAAICVGLGHYGPATFSGLVAIGAWLTMNMLGRSE